MDQVKKGLEYIEDNVTENGNKVGNRGIGYF